MRPVYVLYNAPSFSVLYVGRCMRSVRWWYQKNSHWLGQQVIVIRSSPNLSSAGWISTTQEMRNFNVDLPVRVPGPWLVSFCPDWLFKTTPKVCTTYRK